MSQSGPTKNKNAELAKLKGLLIEKFGKQDEMLISQVLLRVINSTHGILTVSKVI